MTGSKTHCRRMLTALALLAAFFDDAALRDESRGLARVVATASFVVEAFDRNLEFQIVCGAIRSGLPYKITKTAQNATAYLDVRITPAQDPLDVQAELTMEYLIETVPAVAVRPTPVDG